MSNAGISTEDFATHVHSGEFRDAVAGIMGESSKRISLSKNLLISFDQLGSDDRASLLAWCRLPLDKLPVTDQKWLVERIARHEMAHLVVAKALGFSTGNVSLKLEDRSGSHEGKAKVILDCPTPSLETVSDYLDRRLMILLAGYLAESADASERTSKGYLRAIQNNREESDMQKARELIQVKINIQGHPNPDAADVMLRTLVRQSSKIVEAHFSVISVLAQRLADEIKFYDDGRGLLGSDIDQEPVVRQIQDLGGANLAKFLALHSAQGNSPCNV